MDPCLQSKTRLLRLASHNKAPTESSNSNFNVLLGNEIQAVGSEWGGVTGISFDTIGFPNVFPNVKVPWNTILLRTTDPGLDAYATPGENLSVVAQALPGVIRTMVIPATGNATALAAAITAASFNLFPELAPGQNWMNTSISPLDGSIIVTSLQMSELVGADWGAYIGIPDGQLQAGYQMEWAGYPLDPQMFQSVVIPPGFYDNIQLAAAVSAAIQAVVGGVVAITEISPGFDYRYQLTSTIPIQLVIYRAPFYLHQDPRQLLQQMGFFDLPSTTGVLILANLIPQLFGESVVYLHSVFLARDNRSFDGEGQLEHHVLTVPVDVPYLGYQQLYPNQYQNPVIKYATPMSLTEADIRLRNVYGELLDIGDNQQMYVVVRLWYER